MFDWLQAINVAVFCLLTIVLIADAADQAFEQTIRCVTSSRDGQHGLLGRV
jgi:hypothetical protein